MFLTLWLGATHQAEARFILNDLNFNDGAQWEMVGVSLYNFKESPYQKEIGTFTLNNLQLLRKAQQEWNLEPMHQDHCEHHYALKFYRNKHLVKTLRVNLECQYITEGLYSFKFLPQMLLEMKSSFKRIPFSTVHYRDLNRLRKAIDIIKRTPGVYLYNDVEKYRHDGFFVLKTPTVPWNVDRDSLMQAVKNDLRQKVNTTDFHVEPYLFYFEDSTHLSFRYFVYCSQSFAALFETKSRMMTAHWRSHLAFKDPGDERVSVVVIGVDRRRYHELVGEYMDDDLDLY
jgi:hypothetical protein